MSSTRLTEYGAFPDVSSHFLQISPAEQAEIEKESEQIESDLREIEKRSLANSKMEEKYTGKSVEDLIALKCEGNPPPAPEQGGPYLEACLKVIEEQQKEMLSMNEQQNWAMGKIAKLLYLRRSSVKKEAFSEIGILKLVRFCNRIHFNASKSVHRKRLMRLRIQRLEMINYQFAVKNFVNTMRTRIRIRHIFNAYAEQVLRFEQMVRDGEVVKLRPQGKSAHLEKTRNGSDINSCDCTDPVSGGSLSNVFYELNKREINSDKIEEDGNILDLRVDENANDSNPYLDNIGRGSTQLTNGIVVPPLNRKNVCHEHHDNLDYSRPHTTTTTTTTTERVSTTSTATNASNDNLRVTLRPNQDYENVNYKNVIKTRVTILEEQTEAYAWSKVVRKIQKDWSHMFTSHENKVITALMDGADILGVQVDGALRHRLQREEIIKTLTAENLQLSSELAEHKNKHPSRVGGDLTRLTTENVALKADIAQLRKSLNSAESKQLKGRLDKEKHSKQATRWEGKYRRAVLQAKMPEAFGGGAAQGIHSQSYFKDNGNGDNTHNQSPQNSPSFPSSPRRNRLINDPNKRGLAVRGPDRRSMTGMPRIAPKEAVAVYRSHCDPRSVTPRFHRSASPRDGPRPQTSYQLHRKPNAYFLGP